MRRLSHRVVVVTGAGGGIGRAIALEFARCGCRLALSDRDAGALEQTMAALPEGTTASAHVLDVSERAAVAAFVREVEAAHGAAHVLINNAGITVYGPFVEHTAEQLDAIVGVNLWGVVHGCREFLPLLLRQDEGHVVNVSSMAGYVGMPFQSMYCTTKFAVRGLTQALRAELRHTRVGVTSVHPGAVRTRLLASAPSHDRAMTDRMASLMMRWALPPEVVARRVRRAVERDRAEVRMCAETHATWWAIRVAPGVVRWVLGRIARFGYAHMDESRALPRSNESGVGPLGGPGA